MVFHRQASRSCRTTKRVLCTAYGSQIEQELIEDLCTPQISDLKRLKYKPLSQRSVFKRPSGNINEPDTFDVLRRCRSLPSTQR